MVLTLNDTLERKFRKNVNIYTTQDIIQLFTDKYNCKDCPFRMVWKGSIPFGCGDYHRFYCKFSYVTKKQLAIILGLSSKEMLMEFPRINNNISTIDIVRPHPEIKHVYTVSVLYLKEIGECQVDKQGTGDNRLSPINKKLINDYKKSLGLL